MFSTLEAKFLSLRRRLSRSYWLTRLMDLEVSKGSPTRPGLLLIQIDGLAREEFEKALNKGEMPFIKRLLQRERYELRDFYSGLPASTPAVQAELFYGKKCAVPAFSFKDSQTGEIVRMYEPDGASEIERRLEEECDEPLLKDGSAYSNCFTGGASEAHFCPSSMGWGSQLRARNPFVVLVLIITSFYSVLRVFVLLLLELVIGVVDFLRGISHGRSFSKELKFIPTRVAICILLRELCVVGGKIDLYRGLPVIHTNFLGYDEQSHRRGPTSLFAHWTLQGIDDAVSRLWNAAHDSEWRHYDVWIYSDHGQTTPLMYQKEYGRTIHEVVNEVFSKLESIPSYSSLVKHDSSSVEETHRVRFLGGRKFQKLFSVLGLDNSNGPEVPQVVALGPVGFIYPPHELSEGELDFVASELVHEQHVPVVIIRKENGDFQAVSKNGRVALPEEVEKLFGSDHPFVDMLGEDLMRLCGNEHAGAITLLGWHKGRRTLTFAMENGSHAGPSPEETSAFCLLPHDTALPEREHPYLRAAQLREAALWHLGRLPRSAARSFERPSDCSRPLRIMTYNVHSCIGMDGKLSAERIARVIARYSPDVVALQELDVGRSRTQGEDQAELIARYLEMDFHFHPAIYVEGEKYGDAILTHLPMKLIKSDVLPGPGPESKREPRGALWVEVDFYGTPVHVFNTHLGLFPGERKKQAAALLGEDWVGKVEGEAVILCGDFNASPNSRTCQLLRGRLEDAQIQLKSHRPRSTFYSRLPTSRIDHIFVDPALEVTNIEIPRDQLTRLASDHRPLIAEVLIPVRAPESTQDPLSQGEMNH